MKKTILILAILAIVLFSGCTNSQTIETDETPESQQGFSEATEKQIFYELTELQDKYVKECTDESGIPLDCYPIKQQESYSEIAEKYNTTEETIRKIVSKCISNDWPMPPIN